MLAERVALFSWRLNRVTRYETETIALSQEKLEDNLADSRRFDSYGGGPTKSSACDQVVSQAARRQATLWS